MKQTKNIGFAVLALGLALLLGGCRGSEGEIENILIVADVESIVADGLSQVKVVATSGGGEDITSQVQFHHSAGVFPVGGGLFTTTKKGAFTVSASYGGVVSNELEINAVEPAVLPTSRFVRHVCVMDFTATDCAMCPAGQNHMMQVNGQMEDEATKVHLLALHKPGVDPMGIGLANEMMTDFNITENPYYLTDLRDKGGVSSNEEKSAYRRSIMNSTDNYPAHVGVALRCVAPQQGGSEYEVEVSLLSERNDFYRVALFVAEDGIVAEQNVDGTYKSYTHNHVVRKMLSASYRGDNIGAIAAEQSVSKTYTFEMPSEWVPERCKIYALAIDEAGFVNNLGVCCVINDTFGYDYLAE